MATEDAAPDDIVERPKHYTHGKIEVIEVIEAFSLGFHEGNVVKYLLRHQHKGGVQDLLKARWYLNRLIDREGGESGDK